MYFIFKTAIITQTTESYKKLLKELSINDYSIGASTKGIKHELYTDLLILIDRQAISTRLLNKYVAESKLGIIINETEQELDGEITKLKEEFPIIELKSPERLKEILEKAGPIIRNNIIKKEIENTPEEITQYCKKELIDAILIDNISATSQVMQYKLTKEEFNKIKNAYDPKITIKKKFRKQETITLL